MQALWSIRLQQTCRHIYVMSNSEAFASVANEVHKLRERVQQLEGARVPYEPLPESLQRIMEDRDYQI